MKNQNKKLSTKYSCCFSLPNELRFPIVNCQAVRRSTVLQNNSTTTLRFIWRALQRDIFMQSQVTWTTLRNNLNDFNLWQSCLWICYVDSLGLTEARICDCVLCNNWCTKLPAKTEHLSWMLMSSTAWAPNTSLHKCGTPFSLELFLAERVFF